MSETPMLTIALATVPTFLVVLVGILNNNARLTDLRTYMDARFAHIDARFSDEARLRDAERRVNEANFKMLLDKIEDVDNRLIRLEERFARRSPAPLQSSHG